MLETRDTRSRTRSCRAPLRPRTTSSQSGCRPDSGIPDSGRVESICVPSLLCAHWRGPQSRPVSTPFANTGHPDPAASGRMAESLRNLHQLGELLALRFRPAVECANPPDEFASGGRRRRRRFPQHPTRLTNLLRSTSPRQTVHVRPQGSRHAAASGGASSDPWEVLRALNTASITDWSS